MKICKDFKAGNCRYGNRCRFAHPDGLQPSSGIRNHPYKKPNQNIRSEGCWDFTARDSSALQDCNIHFKHYVNPSCTSHGDEVLRQSDGGRGQQQHADRLKQQPAERNTQQGATAEVQKVPGKAAGSGGAPSSHSGHFPPPPGKAVAQQQQQQQQQQQPQQQQSHQRPQQAAGTTALHRARAMCKLLAIGNPAPLVTPEMEASAIRFFAEGAFFRDTPFANSVQKFLPALKQAP